jgi:hypothetical protein
VAALFLSHRRDHIDRFWLAYLAGTLGAYALFPYFPSVPPRTVFPAEDLPHVVTILPPLQFMDRRRLWDSFQRFPQRACFLGPFRGLGSIGEHSRAPLDRNCDGILRIFRCPRDCLRPLPFRDRRHRRNSDQSTGDCCLEAVATRALVRAVSRLPGCGPVPGFSTPVRCRRGVDRIVDAARTSARATKTIY